MPTERVTIVRVQGDLDLATAPLLTKTVAWVRGIDTDRTVVIDTTDVDFIDLAGWRALRACADERAYPGGTPWHVPGVAVARLEEIIAGALRR